MIINSVKLKDFRNYSSLFLNLDPEINIFYGDNAQGKTNILEAVYISGTTRSHKGSKDSDIISFGREEAHIELNVNKNNADYVIDMHLKKSGSKGLAINKIPVKRAGDLFEIINIVFFSPEDLNIIKSTPEKRRKFIDMELCQIDKVYLHDLSRYNKIVSQRNRLLKDMVNDPALLDMLDVYDIQLIDYGNRIINRRKSFINEINPVISARHMHLTGNKEDLNIEYISGCHDNSLAEELFRSRERDIRSGSTNVGPHRDDVRFISNNIDLKCFGSQGQQRTAALSLKLSEIEIMKNAVGDKPVLLLDDVLSELDKNRQEYLLESINDIQTLITCTGLDDFVNHRFNINKIFRVDNGQVFMEN